MALRNEHQVIDKENAIPSRDPELAVARLKREIANGVITDLIDLRAALGSWEYHLVPQTVRDELDAVIRRMA